MVEIIDCPVLDETQLQEFQILLRQLNADCPTITDQWLRSLLDNPRVRLWLAMDGIKIIGSLTLAWYPIPTGNRAWIEDVVVLQDYRGQKIGEALVLHCIKEAKKLGITRIDLTSRPERLAGNKLYQKLGFTKRETNAYRLDINDLK